jgi:hypothetical protein
MRIRTLRWGLADYGPWRTEPLWRRFYLWWIKKPAVTCHCKQFPEPHVTQWLARGKLTYVSHVELERRT